jgi:TATA-box binding protein (TBP) (component of TFIID and TFIIIB)
VYERKTAKLFYNGSVHVTGCPSIAEFLEFSVKISEYLNEIIGYRPALESFKIVMINASSMVIDSKGFPLSYNPKMLAERVPRTKTCTVEYDPERHPGVRFVTYDDDGVKRGTSYVFQTGNISVLGTNSPENMANSLIDVFATLDDLWHMATPTSRLRSTTIRTKFDISCGYITNTYNLCNGGRVISGQ